ncbi:hypothetical protein F4553_001484 [Allocatelliglobosispora scoriae]|uniref:PknH-like extracellular domain-containing protein n=1 Tax=Allocatelliglobosispora scoriae TaxID=643052 RepID=A0A841BKD6_9ACTN|nr:hypothetical protein [Allocatelliglobosispora scoriae]MBB5868105.1 hypothetical protein [Allocatelliglobosispora scoriae]
MRRMVLGIAAVGVLAAGCGASEQPGSPTPSATSLPATSAPAGVSPSPSAPSGLPSPLPETPFTAAKLGAAAVVGDSLLDGRVAAYDKDEAPSGMNDACGGNVFTRSNQPVYVHYKEWTSNGSVGVVQIVRVLAKETGAKAAARSNAASARCKKFSGDGVKRARIAPVAVALPAGAPTGVVFCDKNTAASIDFSCVTNVTRGYIMVTVISYAKTEAELAAPTIAGVGRVSAWLAALGPTADRAPQR